MVFNEDKRLPVFATERRGILMYGMEFTISSLYIGVMRLNT